MLVLKISLATLDKWTRETFIGYLSLQPPNTQGHALSCSSPFLKTRGIFLHKGLQTSSAS